MTHPVAESAPIRVMTFNARVHVPEDGKDTWPERAEAVVRLVRYHVPDVVCFQELAPHQYDLVREALDGYDWIGAGRRDGAGNGEHVPVGVDPDRFRVTDHETFWLSETPDDPGSVGWDATYPRIVTRVSLAGADSAADAGSGVPAADAPADTFHVANTHFDHEGERARAESARVVRDRLAALDGPTVLLGDFNCEPDSDPYRRLVAAEGHRSPGFRDARHLAREGCLGPEHTFHEFTGEPTIQIDHVFVRDCAVVRHATLADRIDDDRYPSDHFPLVADLLPGGNTPR
jgi:endonuclease/exonuclease/phosphatase family metal-dependent hydrolase